MGLSDADLPEVFITGCSQVYYKEAVAAMIVFDCTRQSTFDAVLTWKNDLDSKVLLPNGEPVPCLLLSNKVFNIFRSKYV